MNKILIIIFVPSIEMEYEVYIPINKKIGTIKNIIYKSINELSEGQLIDQNLELFDNDTGDVLPNNIYVKESRLKNGTKLVLA